MKAFRLCALAALCTISGSEWLLQQAWPVEMVWPFDLCLHFALIGLVGAVTTTLQGSWQQLSWRSAVPLASCGVCLFAMPSAALQIAAGKVPEYTSAALFCLVPLMTSLASSVFASSLGEASHTRGLMMPSIVGIAGALLLFPIESPGSLRRWLFLGLVAASCVTVAITNVRIHQVMTKFRVPAALAVIGTSSAALLALYGASIGWPRIDSGILSREILRCAIFDLPIIWLTIWLARETAPARFSSRFLLIPAVTVLEGFAFEHGPVDARATLAILLLCGGGAMLVFKEEPDEIPGLHLR